MNFTATDLFPGWYEKGINKDAAPGELDMRKAAIFELVSNTDKADWLDVLKVYLGIYKSESNAYNKVVGFVRKGDDNFQVQNENLVRILAGCAIGQKIDQNSSLISVMLALGLICFETYRYSNTPIPDLLSRANIFWIRECEKNREINLDFKIGSTVSTSEMKVDIPVLSEDHTTWKANSEAVIKIIKSLQKDLTAANQEITLQQESLKSIKNNFNALGEETNILWWLFKSHSSIANKQFNELSSEILSIFAALELFDLTTSLPGIGGVDNILTKALSETKNYAPNQEFTYNSVIDSLKPFENSLKSNLPKDLQILNDVTPLLTGIQCRAEFNDGWKAVFEKKSTLQTDLSFSIVRLSSSLYKELLLVDIYETI